jgi:succinate dehydrogenase / fumarate reductase flavoprotein subunit
MEVGPTTHYMMGGIQVDAESQMSSVPGLFAAGKRGDCTEPIGWAEIRFPISLVFGKRAGEYAAKFAKENGAGRVNPPMSTRG